MHLKDYLSAFPQIVREAAEKIFNTTIPDKDFDEACDLFSARYMLPTKGDLLEKLQVRSKFGSPSDFLNKVWEMAKTGLYISTDPRQMRQLGLDRGEVNEEGAKRFWAINLMTTMLHNAFVEPFCSELTADIHYIEELDGVIQDRDEPDIREEEQEDLRRKFSRSLIDVKACIKLLSKKSRPGQVA